MSYRRTTIEPRRPETQEPLSDEVIVDFPSMAGLVDRMRASLLGVDDEKSAPPSTERRSPVSVTCPVCGGRGEVWNEVCGVCTGTGGRLLIP